MTFSLTVDTTRPDFSPPVTPFVVEAAEAAAEGLLVGGGHLPAEHGLLPPELVEGRTGDLCLLLAAEEVSYLQTPMVLPLY